MRVRTFGAASLLALSSMVARPAAAQFTLGAGGGTGFGNRGGSASGTHGMAFLQFKLPVLPGVRADAIVMNPPSGVGKVSAIASVVWSVPIPIVTPYVLGGIGKYGLDKSATSKTGWSIGAGVKASLLKFGVFGEFRRHQRIARDLITVGITL